MNPDNVGDEELVTNFALWHEMTRSSFKISSLSHSDLEIGKTRKCQGVQPPTQPNTPQHVLNHGCPVSCVFLGRRVLSHTEQPAHLFEADCSAEVCASPVDTEMALATPSFLALL